MISSSSIIAESPPVATASLPPAASDHAPSLCAPTALIHAESIALPVPTRDNNNHISFPTPDAEIEPTPPTPVAFPTSDNETCGLEQQCNINGVIIVFL